GRPGAPRGAPGPPSCAPVQEEGAIRVLEPALGRYVHLEPLPEVGRDRQYLRPAGPFGSAHGGAELPALARPIHSRPGSTNASRGRRPRRARLRKIPRSASGIAPKIASWTSSETTAGTCSVGSGHGQRGGTVKLGRPSGRHAQKE